MDIGRQFIRFGLVGASSAAINLGLYYLLVWFDWHYVIANSIGWVCSVFNTFLWNNYFVFSNDTHWMINVIKTYITYAFSLLLSTIFLWILVDVWGVSRLVAPVIVMVGMTPINFLVNKYWVFRCKG